MKKLFGSVLEFIQTNKAHEDVALVAAVESVNDKTAIADFANDIKLNLELKEVSVEDNQIDPAILDAAAEAAAVVGAKNRTGLYTAVNGKQEQSFGDALSVDSIASIEHFDGRNIDIFQAATFTYNVEAATQDPFSEAFFPTVIGDVNTGGVKISIRSTKVMNEFLRTTAKSDGRKFNRKSIISALSDQKGILASDQLRLVPVVGGAFDELLSLDLKKDKFYDAAGEKVETAPYKLGVSLNVIGASQSATLLAKGVMDNTDTLDTNLPIENLYFETAVATEILKVDVSNLSGAAFVGGQRGDSKDLVLSTRAKLVVNFSDAKDFVAGGDIAGMKALPAGTKGLFDVELYGSGNAADGEVTVIVGKMELVGAKDAVGKDIDPADAAYAAIKVEADALKAVGVDIGARITNSNLRRKGIHITSTLNSEILPVSSKTPIYTESPVSMQNVGDHDGAFVTDLLAITGIISNFSAVSTLTGFAKFMESQKGVSPADISTGAVGQAIVNPYFKSVTMNLDFFVDGVRSGERRDDIKGALINNIANEVSAMMSGSGFNNYKNYVSRNAKTEIVIGTFPALAAFLGNDIDLGNGCIGKVVSTDNTDISGKIYVSITGGAKNAQDVAVDRFGSRLFVPSLVSQVITSENGATTNKTVVNPLESHLVTLPVLVEFNVTGLSSVLKKTTPLTRVDKA